MKEIILSYLKWAFVISGILYFTIFVGYIVPAIRQKRKIYWSDWFGLNFNWFSYLSEYKEICIEKGIPLFFYRICWGIFIFLAISVTLTFIAIVVF